MATYDDDPIEPAPGDAAVGSVQTARLLNAVGEGLNSAQRWMTMGGVGQAWPGGRLTRQGAAARTMLRYRLPTASAEHVSVTCTYSAQGNGTLTFDSDEDSTSVVLAGAAAGEKTFDAVALNQDFFDFRVQLAGVGARLDSLNVRMDALTEVTDGVVWTHGGRYFSPVRQTADDEPYSAAHAHEWHQTARSLRDRVRLIGAAAAPDLEAGYEALAPMRWTVPFDPVPNSASSSAGVITVWVYSDSEQQILAEVQGEDRQRRIASVDTGAAAGWASITFAPPDTTTRCRLRLYADRLLSWSAWCA